MNSLNSSARMLLATLCVAPAFAADFVSGNLIQFSPNGAWSWYQDERAAIDTAGGKLMVGYVGNRFGVGGPPADGDVNATMFDLSTRRGALVNFKQDYISYGGGDDHNAPAFLVRPDGKYLAAYAGHNNDYYTYYRIHDNGAWGPQQQYDWRTKPGGSDFQTSYSNLFHLSAENRTYNIARTHRRSPQIMVSTDHGNTWAYGGQLSTSADVGYVNGYLKYSSNGVDRIDFVHTEYHPRDFNTSLYHGYIKGGKTYKSDGTVVDPNVFDTLNIPAPTAFTPVFKADTVVRGVTMTRVWNLDMQWYADTGIAVLLKARANNSETDHRFFYARWNGTRWVSTYLGKAGAKLFSSEQDYTGGGALHPDDPAVIFISTSFDPRDSASLGAHEVFKGVTPDHGLTWNWTPVTRNSVRGNLRPIVPRWKKGATALLWWRGTYRKAQDYDAAVVGLLEDSRETVGKMRYLDASASNTTLAAGGALAATGPASGQGAADNLWHWRSGFGNGGSVLTASENTAENAPRLRTRITFAEAGTYDVWVNFWANPTADWRIRAGIGGIDTLGLYRRMAAKQVEPGDHENAITLTGSGNTFLYQAYLGRVQVNAAGATDVFVDDDPVRVATASTTAGDSLRTWYDGVSYAKVASVSSALAGGGSARRHGLRLLQAGESRTLVWTLPRAAKAGLRIHDAVGREVVAWPERVLPAGEHRVEFRLPGEGVYFASLRVDGAAETRRLSSMRPD